MATPPEAATHCGLTGLVQDGEAAYVGRGDSQGKPGGEAHLEVDVAVLGHILGFDAVELLRIVACEAEVDDGLVAADLAADGARRATTASERDV